MDNVSKEDLLQVVSLLQELAKLIIQVVESGGDLGFPSGHLYAQLMGHMSLGTYQQLIEVLIQSGRIEKRGDVLYTPKKRRA